MIALVEERSAENTQRTRTDRDIAGLTLAFLMVTGALWPIGRFFGVELPIPTLIALLVCLIPTTIGALLAAIGLAGMDRALSANVLAKSGKAVELAGDIDTLLLDKTGTITLVTARRRSITAIGCEQRATRRGGHVRVVWDQTPEGKSIVQLGEETLGSNAPRETPAPGSFPLLRNPD